MPVRILAIAVSVAVALALGTAAQGQSRSFAGAAEGWPYTAAKVGDGWQWTFTEACELEDGNTIPAGTVIEYSDNGYDLEDCDGNGYDDHTVPPVPVPWYGVFDGTKTDRIPDGWDGYTRDYEYYFPYSKPPANKGDNNNNNNKVVGEKPAGKDTGSQAKAAAKKFAKSPKPAITGKARVGSTLKAKAGAWKPKPKLSYQWYANGKAIKGATKASLKLKKAQKGKRISVKITAKKTGYKAVSKLSGKTAKVKPA
jgi:hypothetical protein